jgi:hypothetical protein
VAIAARYKGYRYPIEVIGHAVWLYHRFALSLRDVEELMLARGVARQERRSNTGRFKFRCTFSSLAALGLHLCSDRETRRLASAARSTAHHRRRPAVILRRDQRA